MKSKRKPDISTHFMILLYEVQEQANEVMVDRSQNSDAIVEGGVTFEGICF